MSVDSYARARKLALKDYPARMSRRENPYLPVLEEIEGFDGAEALPGVPG